MDTKQRDRSHLFTVRLWLEPVGDQEKEVRGEVRHVLSGDACYFRRLSGLTMWLAAYCDEDEEEENM
jgi:hypothetical protein